MIKSGEFDDCSCISGALLLAELRSFIVLQIDRPFRLHRHAAGHVAASAGRQLTTGASLIRIGIVGCNYGRLVQLPAFRLDPRCEVVALAGTDAARTAELARAADIPLCLRQLGTSSSSTRTSMRSPSPRRRALQPAIAIRALELGKPVFAEKPMAADLAGAAAMARAAEAGGTADHDRFQLFCEVLAWRKAKALLDEGAIGRLRHVAVNWNVENYATRMRLKNWKTYGADGGGALGNFVSHSFHYLEWLCGPIVRAVARLSGLPDDPAMETNAAISLAFQSGAAGSLAMSCASYLGSGHRLEFYGEDGTPDADQCHRRLHARFRA